MAKTERRMVTRSMTQREQRANSNGHHELNGVSEHTNSLPGIRCRCSYLNPMSALAQCGGCNIWFHPECLGLTLPQNPNSAKCPECDGTMVSVGRKRQRENGKDPQLIASRKAITEFPDKAPSKLKTLEGLLEKALNHLRSLGVEPILYPQARLTKSDQAQCLDCCGSSIANATFSASYPQYCISELAERRHKYMQGIAARLTSGRIISLVITNGMDAYSNLGATITTLQSYLKRNMVERTPSVERHLQLAGQVLDDFVHITLIATHEDFRGRGIAKALMVIDLLRWALRGRTRSFVNMAFEKKALQGQTVCFISTPSKRLYNTLGFEEVVSRYEPNGDLIWTKEEADLGRAMTNLDFVPSCQAVVKSFTSAKAAAAKR